MSYQQTKVVTDKRVVLQIKILLNKITNSKNSVNKILAKIIADYSHSTVLENGSLFESWPGMHYYIIKKTVSPFWVEVCHLPARVDWVDIFQGIWYSPDFERASHLHRKKVFLPFSKYPYLKKRNRKYILKTPVYLK